jgi:hypothetical protein
MSSTNYGDGISSIIALGTRPSSFGDTVSSLHDESPFQQPEEASNTQRRLVIGVDYGTTYTGKRIKMPGQPATFLLIKLFVLQELLMPHQRATERP